MAHTTELSRIQADLIQAVQRLSCGVIAVNQDNVVVYANERLLDRVSYTWDELIGQPVHILVPPELVDRLHEESRLMESGDVRARLMIIRRKDSTTFPAVVLPQDSGPSPEGKIDFAVVIDLATMMTAKPMGSGGENSLRDRLDRIALEIQSLGLASAMTAAPRLDGSHPDLQALSERQMEVLVPLVSGERVAGIAKQLHISPHTVRNHLKAMYRHFGVSSQAELIERVRSLGNDG
jgi:PAS domain S-box-containing protein